MRSIKQASGGSTPRITSNDLTQPEAGSSNRKTHGNESPHEVNDLLATVDADNRPCEVLPPYESTGQSSERVAASAPQLRRQVDDVDPQEHEESQTRDSSDAAGLHGDPPHATSDETQGTPRVVPDTRRLAMDDVGITATSRGSGVERTVQREYHSAMLRDESLTPGLKARLPETGQPSARGKVVLGKFGLVRSRAIFAGPETGQSGPRQNFWDQDRDCQGPSRSVWSWSRPGPDSPWQYIYSGPR